MLIIIVVHILDAIPGAVEGHKGFIRGVRNGRITHKWHRSGELCASFPTCTHKNFMLHHAVTSVLAGDSSALMGLDQALSEVQREEGSET